MLTAAILTALQTEGLAAEIVASQRATTGRGSYELHMAIDQALSMEAMQMELHSEGRGVWERQVPRSWGILLAQNLLRVRMRTTGRRGQSAMPEQETEVFTAGARIWQRSAGGWFPIEFPPGIVGADPIEFLERTLRRADEVAVEASQAVDGVRCKKYRVVLNGPAVAGLMREMMGDMTGEIVAEGSSMVMRILAGEEDRLIRKIEGETRVRVRRGGVGGQQAGQGQNVREIHATQTITMSRFGEVQVDIPGPLRDQVVDRN